MQRIIKPLACAVGLALSTFAIAAPSSRFDITELDTNISPCADFGAFVNAKWMAANPVPADRTRWGSFDILAESSLDAQRGIAEDAAAHAAAATPGSAAQQVGYFYASGMDEAAIEKAGYDPLKPQLARIGAMKNGADVAAYIRGSYADGDGVAFRFGGSPDFKDSSRQIAYARQGGLGLPTADYYSKPEHAKVRDAYLTHVARSLQLIGVSAAEAQAQAKAVLAFETRLAAVSLTPTELRKPENQYRYTSIAEADKITPHFDWATFFHALGADVKDGFSLSQPEFFAEFDKMLAETPIADWQAYLRFHAVDDAAPYLSKAFQQQHFEFHDKTLQGQQDMEARWRRVLESINRYRGAGFGMALGELYAAKYFPPESRQRAQALVDNLRAAYKRRIEQLEWMSPATKQKALEKWASFTPKIGYPDQWPDWRGLTLKPGDYFGNVHAVDRFIYAREIHRIGKPVDRRRWLMTPQMVNAYYAPQTNEIVFPAAILQPPFFDAKADDALNYGAIGAVIGHEMGHGYDDQGSRFDAEGNQVSWWTDADHKAFEERTARLAAQFDGYEAAPGKFINGKLTMGENIGDLAGLNAAYDALHIALAQHPAEAKLRIDGYTQDQRFFLNWARVWRGNTREARLLTDLNTDPHSPVQFRAIGAPSNMPAFAQAFQCKPGDKMVRPAGQQVKIW